MKHKMINQTRIYSAEGLEFEKLRIGNYLLFDFCFLKFCPLEIILKHY